MDTNPKEAEQTAKTYRWFADAVLWMETMRSVALTSSFDSRYDASVAADEKILIATMRRMEDRLHPLLKEVHAALAATSLTRERAANYAINPPPGLIT